MAFITRCSTRPLEALLAALLLAGCTQEPTDHGFAIRSVQLATTQGVAVRLDQELQLSNEAREALRSGVPLTIGVHAQLRRADSRRVLADTQRRFVIRYLPLSEHYQLEEDASGLRTFPRLRHVIAALERMEVAMDAGPLPPGAYQLRTRVRLEHSRLPTPMQLPAALSRQWRHDSEWSSWPVTISA